MFENPAAQKVSMTTADAKIKNSGIKTAQGIFETYKTKDERINIDDFLDVYSAEEIERDKERVKYFKKSKDYEIPTEYGVVLENLFCDLAEKHEWFGEGVKIVQLSEFDDMIASGAHCDVVLEIPVGSEGFVARIGIDLTTAVNYDNLSKKRTKCVGGVQNGRLFSVKYFKSKIDGTKGKISNMPVFFAGINKENIDALCAAVAKKENTGIDNLKKHEAQFMFLDELENQTESYAGIALSDHGPDASVTFWMNYYKELIEWMNEDKKSLRPNNFGQKASQDEVYRYITRFA